MKYTWKLLLCLLALVLCVCTAMATEADTETTPECEHMWTLSEVTKAATCTVEGSGIYTCTLCSGSETQVVPATGHVLGCDSEYKSCVHCGATDVSGEKVHLFSGTYSYNSTEHWQECYCRQETALFDKHTFTNGVCEICQPECQHVWDWDNWQSDETHHWVKCKNCDETNSDDTHSVNCTDGACYDCGRINSATEPTHLLNDPSEYQFDGTQHWEMCLNCENAVHYSNHSPSDKDPTKCGICGANIKTEGGICKHDSISTVVLTPSTCVDEGEGMDVCNSCGYQFPYTVTLGVNSNNHDIGNNNWQFDQSECWYTCSLCGNTEAGRAAHTVRCNSNVCTKCGATATDVIGSHSLDSEWQSDDTKHWKECIYCGQPLVSGNHDAPCGYTGDTCQTCNKTGITITPVHEIGSNSWQYTTAECWYTCSLCEQDVERTYHWRKCIDKECMRCGATEFEPNTGHGTYDITPWQSNETQHWKDCIFCGEDLQIASHTPSTNDTSLCSVCGATFDFVCTNHNYYYVADGEECVSVCSICKEESPNGRTIHTITCVNDSFCARCGSEDLGDTFFEHESSEQKYNETQHYIYCSACNKNDYFMAHVISCKNAGVCVECKATNVTGAPGHNYNFITYDYNDTLHWFECLDCKAHSDEQAHWNFCNASSGTCQVCLASGVNCNTEHEWDWENYDYDAESHWIPCLHNHPDAKLNVMAHRVTCADLTTCADCGAKGVTGRADHVMGTDGWKSDDDECWYICDVCGTESSRWKHGRNCENTSCWQCGRSDVTFAKDAISHGINITSIWHYDDTQHWKNCIFCGEAFMFEDHMPDDNGTCECGKTGLSISCVHTYAWVSVQDPTCTQDGMMEYTCSKCGDVADENPTSALDHNPTTSTTAATCTASGRETTSCTRCGITISSSSIPALGHDLSTTDNGSAIVESCSRCSYRKETPKATATPAPTVAPTATPAPTVAPTATPAPTVAPTATPAPTVAPTATPAPTVEPTATPAPTVEPTAVPTVAPAELPKDVVVKPVENVVIEVEFPVSDETEDTEDETTDDPAEESKPEVEVKNVQISVNEVELMETPVVLPLPAEVEVAKVITIQMTIPEVTEEEKVLIPEKLKISLPVTEAEIASLANTKLVLVLEDGSMLEIPYEVVDGKLVFTTTQMGVFAFITVE